MSQELALSVGGAYGIPTVALRFFNIYGCTETNDSMMHEFSGLSPEGGLSPSFPPTKLPIGKPIQGVEARIEIVPSGIDVDRFGS